MAEIIDAVHRGRIGHGAAIRALGLRTYDDLLETMHANALPLWAHRPFPQADRQTRDLLAQACGKRRSADLQRAVE